MTWNYRVLAKTYEDIVELGIYEVYYTKEKPTSFTERPVGIIGDDIEDIEEVLNKMRECLNKPILSYEKFPEEYKTV